MFSASGIKACDSSDLPQPLMDPCILAFIHDTAVCHELHFKGLYARYICYNAGYEHFGLDLEKGYEEKLHTIQYSSFP